MSNLRSGVMKPNKAVYVLCTHVRLPPDIETDEVGSLAATPQQPDLGEEFPPYKHEVALQRARERPDNLRQTSGTSGLGIKLSEQD